MIQRADCFLKDMKTYELILKLNYLWQKKRNLFAVLPKYWNCLTFARTECRMLLVEVNEKCIGCTLEIRWKCKAVHYGDWQSSKIVNRVYVNNIQSAASLLFTGNNFAKLSLFSKCFGLAFISSSTFGRYQKKFLARSVDYWWNAMQEKMFEALGDQPVMDSPGFLAKNYTYTLMHATSDCP